MTTCDECGQRVERAALTIVPRARRSRTSGRLVPTGETSYWCADCLAAGGHAATA